MNIPLGPPGDEQNAKRIMCYGSKFKIRRPQGDFLDYCKHEDPWKIIEKHCKYQALQEAYWQLWILSTVYEPHPEELTEEVKDLGKSLRKFIEFFGGL
jgi:hypothetical protein